MAWQALAVNGALMRRVGELLDAEVVGSRRLSGGDVAEAYAVELSDGRRVFAKTHRQPPPGFFTTEATGLEWLAEPGVIPVPAVLGVHDGDRTRPDRPPLLILEWIEEGTPAGTGEAEFGRALARLHRVAMPSFGRPDRRTTGSRALPNEPCDSWASFLALRRLGPLADLAESEAALDADAIRRVRRLTERLLDVDGAPGDGAPHVLVGPPEPPARLHGDLWAGNRLVDAEGRSWLIDPAALGGHREFDLAMMRLFGGFGDSVFEAYADEWPLAEGWRQRLPLHQLAPLIVHAIKFGPPYDGAVRRALEELRPILSSFRAARRCSP